MSFEKLCAYKITLFDVSNLHRRIISQNGNLESFIWSLDKNPKQKALMCEMLDKDAFSYNQAFFIIQHYKLEKPSHIFGLVLLCYVGFGKAFFPG